MSALPIITVNYLPLGLIVPQRVGLQIGDRYEPWAAHYVGGKGGYLPDGGTMLVEAGKHWWVATALLRTLKGPWRRGSIRSFSLMSRPIAPGEAVLMGPLPRADEERETYWGPMGYEFKPLDRVSSFDALIDEFLAADRDFPVRGGERWFGSVDPEGIVEELLRDPERQGHEELAVEGFKVSDGKIGQLVDRTDMLVLGTNTFGEPVFGIPEFHKIRAAYPDDDWHDVSSVLESLCRPPAGGNQPEASNATAAPGLVEEGRP